MSLLPCDRPPLSKAVLRGKYELKPLKVDYEGLGVDLRIAVAAASVGPAARLLLTSAGPLEFSHLVIATGARPIRLPGEPRQLHSETTAPRPPNALARRARSWGR
jgi:NADPH-dependent 2,4-dienoyl-CoA reductase/sulfur reductase-like enzyme